MPSPCTKEQAQFAREILSILQTSLQKVKRANSDLTNKLNYLTRVQNDPVQVAKLQAGIGALTDYTIEDLLAAKTYLNDIKAWVENKLRSAPNI